MIIYRYTNKTNGKVYIGQTIKTLEERHSKHICFAMTRNNHYALHKAFRKYGPDNFILEQIDTASTQEELDQKEIYWIEQHKSYGKGYNMTPGGKGDNAMTDDIKSKISETRKRQWQNMPEQWKKEKMEALRQKRLGSKQSDFQKKCVTEANQLSWNITDPEGNTFMIQNLNAFCKEHGLDQGNMVKISQGKAKKHKGYSCTKA